jgi:hypothetical protein
VQTQTERTVHVTMTVREAADMFSELTGTVLHRLTITDKEACPTFMRLCTQLDAALAED